MSTLSPEQSRFKTVKITLQKKHFTVLSIYAQYVYRDEAR